MTITSELEELFEAAFVYFEKHRMYPPNHIGVTMITINPKHLKAVSRAQHFVRSGISPSMLPKHVEAIENDIFLLGQVHSYILQQIKEPGLPMSPEPIEVGDIAEDHGKKDSKS